MFRRTSARGARCCIVIRSSLRCVSCLVTIMLRYPYFAGLLVLLGNACSGDDDGDDARSRTEFCQEWATAACSDDVVSACQAASADECRTAQAAFCLTLIPENFSDESGDACLKAVGSAYRDADLTAAELPVVLRLGSPCDKVIQGPRDQGESCSDTRDCNAPDGYVCVLKGGAATGTCQRPETVGAGRSCAALQHVCEPGFYCNGTHCVEAQLAGGTCASHEECGEEGYCDTDGTCTGRLSVNSPCTDDVECLSGLCYVFGDGDQTCTDRLVLSRSEPICENLR
jgi:hypothetical protein